MSIIEATPVAAEGRMKQKPLTKAELEGMHSVLRRCAERAEHNNDRRYARELNQALIELEAEIAEACTG